jgi:WD40 repeat protein
MGKSSLRVRTMQRLQQEGFVCAVIDPQKKGTTLREDQWYAGTIRDLIRDLNLGAAIDFKQWWKDLDEQSFSLIERFYEFINRVLLPNIPQKIAIFVEEIDTLLSLNSFDSDGFFLLIRSLYEQRAEKPEYQRLTFAFLGVATPADLIKNKERSSFNVGYAVAMSGFQLHETESLARGLAGKVSDPQACLAAVLHWTGGQPFLTQKILTFIAAKSDFEQGSLEEMVSAIVHEKVIENWESQDNPAHLKTIRDRILQSDERGRGRLLGLYQQILDSDGIPADESYDQMLLRLTGLVVKRDGRLMVYNPIYGAVFNQAWVSRALADMRPNFYAEALRVWQETEEGLRDSFLLRGQALEEIEAWAKGKRLSDEDDRFLQSSREVEKQAIALSLEAERLTNERLNEANETLNRANETAKRRVRIGSLILAGTLVAAVLVIFGAKASVDESDRKVANTRKEAKEITDIANRDKDIADSKAKAADGRAKDADEKIKKAAAELKIAKVETEKAKTDKEKADSEVERAKGDLAKLKNDAQVQLASARVELDKAEEARKRASRQVALAEVRLESVNAKVAFLDNRGIESLLFALRSAQKIKKIPFIVETDEERMDISVNLEKAIYGTYERNRFEQLSGVLIENFSSYNRKFITIDDKFARVWDDQGNLLYELKGHQDRILSAAFSSDGSKIVTASLDKTAKVWDSKGHFLCELKTQYIVSSVAFSLDGSKIISNSGLWDDQCNFLYALKGNDTGNGVIVSPDGNRIFTTSEDGTSTARMWDIQGNLLYELKHQGGTNSAAFSPDGSTIVTTTFEDNIAKAKVWDIQGKFLCELKGHRESILNVAFSPDGSKIVTTSFDQTAKVWDVQCNLLYELQGHQSFVLNASFSSDGSKIVTASHDKTIRVWDAIKGYLMIELKGHQHAVNSARFSLDGTKIISASRDKTLRVWDIGDKSIVILKGTGFDGFNHGSFSPDSNKVVTDLGADTSQVWDVKGTPVAKLIGQRARFSPDSTKIVTVSDDNIVRLWNTNGTLIVEIRGHQDSVFSAAFSFDGSKIITSSADKTAKVWNINGTFINEIRGHQDSVFSAAFSPDGSKIITNSNDTVRVWDLRGNLIFKLTGNYAKFSPDGSKIAINSGNGTEIWDPNGTFITEIKGYISEDMIFSPDGNKIVTISPDNTTVLVWDMKGILIAELKGHQYPVISANFSPDGNRIITSSRDNTARVWSIKGDQIAILEGHLNRVVSASFSADGRKMLTVSLDTTSRVWEFESDFDRLLTLGCNKLHDYLSTNPNATDSDRQMCGIEPRKK